MMRTLGEDEFRMMTKYIMSKSSHSFGPMIIHQKADVGRNELIIDQITNSTE